MSDDWRTNLGAVDYRKRLLSKLGYPLELRVQRIGAGFDLLRYSSWASSAWSESGSIIYGGSEAEAAREIDYHLHLGLDGDGGDDSVGWLMQVELLILIECKHREGLEIYGFPLPDPPYAQSRPPIITDAAHTPLFQTMRRQIPPFEVDAPLCTLGMLQRTEKEKGGESLRSHDEQLDYKAAGALYDYIRYLVPSDLNSATSAFFEEHGLSRALEQLPQGDGLLARATAWCREHLTDAQCAAYNTLLWPQDHADVEEVMLPPLMVIVPILCTDASLSTVTVDEAGTITAITPAPALLTRSRLPGWPKAVEAYLLQPSREAPLWIVQVDALEAFLHTTGRWFSDLYSDIARIGDQQQRDG